MGKETSAAVATAASCSATSAHRVSKSMTLPLPSSAAPAASSSATTTATATAAAVAAAASGSGRRTSGGRKSASAMLSEQQLEEYFAAALKAWHAEHPLGTCEERRKQYYDFMAQAKAPVQPGSEPTLFELAAVNDVAALRSRLLFCSKSEANSGSPGSTMEVSPIRSVSMASVRTQHSATTEPHIGEDVDARDASGQTALHHAVAFGALDAAVVLLSAGWDSSLDDCKGRLPVDVASEGGYLSRAGKIVDAQSLELHVASMVLLLLIFGAQPPSATTWDFFSSSSRKRRRVASSLSLAWPRLSGICREVLSWEPKQADFMRHWSRFLETIPAAVEQSGGNADALPSVFGGCALLSLVLQSDLVLDVLPPLPSDEATSSSPSKEAEKEKEEKERVTAAVLGLYRWTGEDLNGQPTFVREPSAGPRRRLVWQAKRWAIIDDKSNELCISQARTGPVLGSEWRCICIEAHSTLYQTYSSSSFLPPVDSIERVPTLGLLNPNSGNKMGAPFLEEARIFPMYRPYFFNIIHVATRPVALAAFRRSLELAREEALSLGTRARLISGGGDGTASFAISCVFKAIRAKQAPGAPGPSKIGEFWEWSEEELKCSFPALVQMPLGTGNDLAGVLGWGRAITPLTDREQAREWLTNALSSRRIVVPFDVWGLETMVGAGLKVCSLAGLDKNHPDRPQFQTAGASVPFLCLLYFSLGYEAFIAGQVELNRTDSRLMNFLEYGKAIPATMVGSQRRVIDLSGIKIRVPNEKSANKDEQRIYFPPEGKGGGTGSEYATVGCMNINSFGGGTWSATDPAKFGDGLIDLFRQRNYFGNVLRRGRTYDTEKHSKAAFALPAELPGVHVQYDGEARFLFHPEQEAAGFDMSCVMQIPAVLGPDTQEIPVGASSGWIVAADRDCPGVDAAFIPGTDLDECKALCLKHGFGGFCIFKRKAYFRAERPESLRLKLTVKLGATFYIPDASAQDVRFSFTLPEPKALAFQRNLFDWVSGKFVSKINATPRQVSLLQKKSDSYAKGLCARAARAYVDFAKAAVKQYGDEGPFSSILTPCATCGARCGSWGCQGCRRPFCRDCFAKHKGSAPSVKWHYGDIAALRKSISVSAELCLRDAQKDLRALTGAAASRPITLMIYSVGEPTEKEALPNAEDAIAWLESYEAGDSQAHSQPRSLVTFHKKSFKNVSVDGGTVFVEGMGDDPSLICNDDEDPVSPERLESWLSEDGSSPSKSSSSSSSSSSGADDGEESEDRGPSSRRASDASRTSDQALSATASVTSANGGGRRDSNSSLRRSWQKEAHLKWKAIEES